MQGVFKGPAGLETSGQESLQWNITGNHHDIQARLLNDIVKFMQGTGFCMLLQGLVMLVSLERSTKRTPKN